MPGREILRKTTAPENPAVSRRQDSVIYGVRAEGVTLLGISQRTSME